MKFVSEQFNVLNFRTCPFGTLLVTEPLFHGRVTFICLHSKTLTCQQWWRGIHCPVVILCLSACHLFISLAPWRMMMAPFTSIFLIEDPAWLTRLSGHGEFINLYTERGGSSFARFWRQEFGEFPWLVGRYCSYLLPKQMGELPKFQWTNVYPFVRTICTNIRQIIRTDISLENLQFSF